MITYLLIGLTVMLYFRLKDGESPVLYLLLILFAWPLFVLMGLMVFLGDRNL